MVTPLQAAMALSAIQNGGKLRKPKKQICSANQFYPWKVEREMENYIAEVMKNVGENFKALALVNYSADGLDDLTESEVYLPSDIDAKAGELYDKAALFNFNAIDKFTEKAIGRAVGFYPNDTGLRDTFVTSFVNTCKSAGEDLKKEIATAVYNRKMFPSPEGSLVGDINTINKKYTASKARFIARNETGNLNAAIQRKQQEGAGFDMYEWLAMTDGVTRDTHRNMNGLVCKWKDPTVYSDDGGKTWKKRNGSMFVGTPGQDYNCRCSAVPFVPELEDVIEVEEPPKPEPKAQPLLEKTREELESVTGKLKKTERRREILEQAAKRHATRTPEQRTHIIEKWEERHGEFSYIKDDKTIDKISTFKGVKEKAASLGVDLSDDFKSSNLDRVRACVKALDTIKRLFPKLEIEKVEKIRSRSCYMQATRSLMDRFGIGINASYIKKGALDMPQGGFHPKNLTPYSCMAHELGHIVNYNFAKKLQGTAIGYESYAKNLVHKVANKYNDLHGTAISVMNLRKSISGYADEGYKYTETIAESFADVFANKGKASEFSKAVYREVVDIYNESLKKENLVNKVR